MLTTTVPYMLTTPRLASPRLTSPRLASHRIPFRYKFLGTLAGVEVIDVPRRPDFSVDIDAVCAAIRKYKASICFLPSPNNPTGTVLPNSACEQILQEDCLLVCDEAYADFCDVTALDLFSKYDNLIVCRTFSKWAGLAGTALSHRHLVHSPDDGEPQPSCNGIHGTPSVSSLVGSKLLHLC